MARCFGIQTFIFSLFLFYSLLGQTKPSYFRYTNQTHVLSIEILTDTLIHFEYSRLSQNHGVGIEHTPMVLDGPYKGAAQFRSQTQGFETRAGRVTVDPNTLCADFFDIKQNKLLTQMCPTLSDQLTLTQESILNIYGLGEQFHNLGDVNGDWNGITRTPGNQFGNALVGFGGGAVGNAQIPVMYALGAQHLNYALFLDDISALAWDFTSPTWKISHTLASNTQYRGYFILGDQIADLRRQFMDLVGHAPVPPKKALGLWVSEYGYHNWKEIDDRLDSLRAHHFPLDGFVLDLYWYGGVQQHSPDSSVGVYDWDQKNFPNAREKISDYEKTNGINLMLIEESYVSKNKKFYELMNQNNFLVKKNSAEGPPVTITDWWGLGGMIDWTQDAAGSLWHDQMRKPLTDVGITFHWTDLGEPESFTNENWYAGSPQDKLQGGSGFDFHNLYNFKWIQSISDGYTRHHETKRHFILSRSGTAGIQRFGAGMWSGDIGSNLRSLSSHLNVQGQMSLSGIDYFGSDIGGFHREALEGDMNQVYTRWFAHSAWFDFPVRPHTDNGNGKNYTAPDQIGDLKSNLANIRQRYELAPYYYSLAHAAYTDATPIVAPLVYYFQNDLNVRTVSDEKMIGPSLLVATSAMLDQNARSLYLPQGTWIDYHTGIWYQSDGEVLPNLSVWKDGAFQLPAFVKAGAILPKVVVDDASLNILGKRADGTRKDDFIVEVFGDAIRTTFTAVEDDGITESYKTGARAVTFITQSAVDRKALVQIAATTGTYQDAPTARYFEVRWRGNTKRIKSVFLNGLRLAHFNARHRSKSRGKAVDLDNWVDEGPGGIKIRAFRNTNEDKNFEIRFY